jgi:hypothetical protein
MYKMMASFVTAAALMASAPAFAADCAGLEGKDLEKCEKKNASAAKQDTRSVAYLPSALHADLAAWDAAEKNPFATDAYRVRVTEAGIPSVDAYLGKAFKVQATMAFAKYVVDESTKGNVDAMKLAPKLVPMVQEAVGAVQALVTEGQDLVTNKVPAEIKADPKLAMKGPKALTALKDGLAALQSAATTAPEIGKSIAAIVPAP